MNQRLAPLLLPALLAGCATPTPPAPSPGAGSEQAFCDRLQKVVSAADNGFADIKGQFHGSSWMRVWETGVQFEGGNCQIWGWGTGKTGYNCSWEDRNPDIAKQRFDALQRQVRNCLSADWTQRSDQPTEKVHGTWFGHAGKSYRVAVNQIDDSGPLVHRWRTYLFVGHPEAALYKQKQPPPQR